MSKMMVRFQTLLIFFFEKVLPEALCAYFPFFRHGKFPVLSALYRSGQAAVSQTTSIAVNSLPSSSLASAD